MTPLKQGIARVGRAAWRHLPRGLRRQGMAGVAAVLAARPDTVPPESCQGVVVAGDIHGNSGLAESARIMRAGLAALGALRGELALGLPGFVEMAPSALPDDAALLAVVNANILPPSLLRLPRGALRRRRVIGLWAWELPVTPPAWAQGAKFVHEVWAPSAFSAAAFAPLAPGRVRVVPYPLAIAALPAEGSRADFGLPEDVFLVTTIFNLASSMVRKNPLGAIAAFKAAFGASRDHLFVLKLANTAFFQEDLAVIRQAIGDAPNIRLVEETISEPRLRGLIRAADVVLSLHRAEGFGLIPATAMLLGRPVVATGWSGNLDFMTPEVSGLVSCRLVPARDPRGTYALRRAQWAEPDIEDAAAQLRALAADPARRAAMAQAGQAHARAALGLAPLRQALAAGGIA